MVRKYLLAGAIIAAFTVPSVAATMAAATWYVAQDAKTKKCSVTTKKPDGTKMIMIGKETDTYKTKADATKAEKAAAECVAAAAPAKPKPKT
jgi:hypothetical protein